MLHAAIDPRQRRECRDFPQKVGVGFSRFACVYAELGVWNASAIMWLGGLKCSKLSNLKLKVTVEKLYAFEDNFSPINFNES